MPTSWFVVDVETDGPAPGLYSMVSLGAVRLNRELATTCKGLFGPLHDADYDPEALAVSNTTREQHLTYPSPQFAMNLFHEWVVANTLPGTRPVFVSDNPAFDWQFVNYYFHRFIGKNPFGFSARRIGDIYAGLVKDARAHGKWKKFRKTEHTHDPVDDAKGNAEALLYMVDNLGLKVEGLS